MALQALVRTAFVQADRVIKAVPEQFARADRDLDLVGKGEPIRAQEPLDAEEPLAAWALSI